MGNFYTNYTALSTDSALIARTLAGRSAFITSVPGKSVVVFDKVSDLQNQSQIKSLGAHISEAAGCPVLAVLNHDDDILWYCLFVNGQEKDEYDSTPGYFNAVGVPSEPTGGNAALLCQTFGSANVEQVETILRSQEYTFAVDRHQELAQALGIPSYGVGASYQYITKGELPFELSQGDLIDASQVTRTAGVTDRQPVPAAPEHLTGSTRQANGPQDGLPAVDAWVLPWWGWLVIASGAIVGGRLVWVSYRRQS